MRLDELHPRMIVKHNGKRVEVIIVYEDRYVRVVDENGKEYTVYYTRLKEI
jgi:hypothetical protein